MKNCYLFVTKQIFKLRLSQVTTPSFCKPVQRAIEQNVLHFTLGAFSNTARHRLALRWASSMTRLPFASLNHRSALPADCLYLLSAISRLYLACSSRCPLRCATASLYDAKNHSLPTAILRASFSPIPHVGGPGRTP